MPIEYGSPELVRHGSLGGAQRAGFEHATGFELRSYNFVAMNPEFWRYT
jgi:hypothetical protein